MKIYRKIVINIKGEIIEENSYKWKGEVARCKGGTSTTTTSTPSWQEPYLTDVAARAKALSGENIQAYPGETVAGFTPAQQLAQNLTIQKATGGNPLLGAAQTEATKTISGDYLNPNSNPWLNQSYQEAAKNIGQKFNEITNPAIKSQAMGAGMFGGDRQGVAEGIAQRGLAQSLGETATGIYGPAYQQERGLQQQAVQNAPALNQAGYYDIGQLAATGEEQQNYQQSLINEAIKRYETGQLSPWNTLGMYSNLVSGDYGGTSQSMSSGK